jgi:HAD superfamily hydrolase (TIGR01509 family)
MRSKVIASVAAQCTIGFTVTTDLVTDNSQVLGGWRPRAAVFDFDGVLVDSAQCWEQAYAAIARQRGRTLEDVDLAALTGASIDQAAAALGAAFGAPVAVSELERALQDRFAATAPRVLPGARELVAALTAAVPLAVATNGPPELVGDALVRTGLRPAFGAVVSAQDAGAAKPDPAVYLEACRRCAVAPEAAIAFEDSAVGARAARTAGMMVVLVGPEPDPEADADLTVSGLDDPALASLLTATERRVAAD